MSNKIEHTLWQYPSPTLTEGELAILLKGTKDSLYSRLKRCVKKGQLIRIKRGLYCLGDRLHSALPHPFEVAQKIYGPSYISLESALSYHGLIPEAVHTITSVTIKRNQLFDTPLGHFSYLRLPTRNFYSEVDYIKDQNSQYLIASPWKALLDYIYCYKKDWKNMDPLVESLRIEFEELPKINKSQLRDFELFYKNHRIRQFIRNIPAELLNEH